VRYSLHQVTTSMRVKEERLPSQTSWLDQPDGCRSEGLDRNPDREESTRAIETIQEHFKDVYGRRGGASFAMDIEFKVDAEGGLVVKQARPWVE
jgi:hypothetical protein